MERLKIKRVLRSPVSSEDLLKVLVRNLEYLTPMLVKNYKVCDRNNEFIKSENSYDTYSLCPRCDHAIEYDYQTYCDNCGQHLMWGDLENMEQKE